MDRLISDDGFAAAVLRGLLGSPAQGIIVVDSSGCIRLANNRAEAMFGYGHGELPSRNIEVLVPEDVRPIHAEEMEIYSSCPRSRAMGLGVDLRGRRCDGSEFPIEISLNHLNVAGETLVVGLISDITERTQMEQHGRRAQKLDAMGQVAGGAAYEIQQLLDAVSTHVGTALSRGQGDAVLTDSVKALTSAAGKAGLLARQLLTITGTHAAERQWIDLNQRLCEMRALLRRMVGEKIELELALGEDLGEILADPEEVEQIILNLVRNAGDAMPEGGHLKIETAGIEVGEACAGWHLPVAPGPHILLTVTDSGVGMVPELEEHLFEPFFTTKTTSNRKGLGLATAYGIAKNSGGSISAGSQPDRGTTVQVIIPRIRPAAERPSPVAQGQASA